MGKVLAVCRSDKRGVTKDPIPEGVFEDGGLRGDAHADPGTHRQVSLLAKESIDKMRALGLKLKDGDFAENLTTEGIDLPSLVPGTRISVGDGLVLEITQIGKECHSGCAIARKVGKCIMPKEGIFGKVITAGVVRPGDTIRIQFEARHESPGGK